MPARRGTLAELEPRRIDAAVEDLLLDALNPRFIRVREAVSQEALLKTLWDEMAVDEVAFSIAQNGYFKEERLLVVPRQSTSASQKYTVIEGNRRLAAVLLLRSEQLRQSVGATDLPSISEARRRELDKLPVSVYESRQQLWQYLGFRHINGPKPWDAFSKARYVADVHEKLKQPLPEIANSIGDRHATVRRLYRGLVVFRQAEDNGFDPEDVTRGRFFFSHLYTAADQHEFRRYLGIAEDSLKPNPVPRGRIRKLQNLMLWLYGSKRLRKPALVQTQNPDLNTLREALSTDAGIAALEAGMPLHRAREISIGDERRFTDAVTRAKDDLQEAKATVTTGYRGQPELAETMDEIVLVAKTIRQEMATIPETRKRRS